MTKFIDWLDSFDFAFNFITNSELLATSGITYGLRLRYILGEFEVARLDVKSRNFKQQQIMAR